MNTTLEEQEKYSILAGDVLLTRTSETLDELGMSSVAIHDYTDATYSGFLKRLRPTEEGDDVCYPKFMAHYLRGPLFRKAMNNNAVMTLRCSLNEEIYSYLELLLPEYEQQKKLGDFLYLIHEKIELNNQINAELEAMAKLLYDYWFVQFDFPISAEQAAAMGKPHLEGEPYKSSGGRMEFNEELNREIPERWSLGTIENLGTIVGGSTPSKKIIEYYSVDGQAWITPKDLSNNKGKKFIAFGEIGVTPKGMSAGSLKVLPTGSVLMSSRAPIGYLAIAEVPVTTNQGFKSVIPDKGFDSNFIYLTLQHYMKLIKAKATGTTFKEVSGGTLKIVKICLPEKPVLDSFAKSLSQLARQQLNLERQNRELTDLRDWLLPMLMNGQVTIG
jgi:type I restriction enzyme S subunit